MAMMLSVDDVCDILWEHHLHLFDGSVHSGDVSKMDVLTPWVIVDEVIEALVTSEKIVDVERCANCKWWNEEWKHEDGECYCYKIDQWTAPQFFCASGERSQS